MAQTRKRAPARAPTRAPAPKTLIERTPRLEWVAAAIGLVLTLGVVGYSAWEGLAGDDAPSDLRARVTEIQQVGAGHVAAFEVRNLSTATAADVEVSARLSRGGAVVEEHAVTLDYVPGKGAAKGGVVFEQDPTSGQLSVTADAYADP